MGENIIKIKSFDFALNIIQLCQDLVDIRKEYILSKQLLRSGTAIGALVREAEHAESKADFIHKMSIALKEANETEYWIELLYKSNYVSEQKYLVIVDDLKSILKLLISIVKTSKFNR
jgi:four helix bundle protein